jgi:indolepyruvate ferredoxin oxidoreductase beta subunit
MNAEPRPFTILIGALGGEGGGVLTDWIVSAATAADLPVQSTSIPGVAQRTGATTYYIEIYPVRAAALGGRYPVMALYPGPGNIDLVVASELLEAGRAIELGFVSPDRTTLLASTHRVYSIAEKSAMGDGRYHGEQVIAAGTALAARTGFLDLAEVARGSGAQLNAVLLGAIAAFGSLPLSLSALEGAIRSGGKAVDANLAGFRAGLESMRAEEARVPGSEASRLPPPLPPHPVALAARLAALPEATRPVVTEGAALVLDYQDERYVELYLERVELVKVVDEECGGGSRGYALTAECARELALWMCYEDVVRVADLKSRASRLARIRREVGAREEEPLRVTEYLKPGIDELCAIAPPALARALRAVAGRRRPQLSLRVGTHTVTGHLLLRALACLRPWRRRSERFVAEQALAERWLALVRTAAARDYDLGLEVVACASLNKGYGEIFERTRGSFLKIVDAVLARSTDPGGPDAAADMLRHARKAALADPQGQALDRVLGESA